MAIKATGQYTIVDFNDIDISNTEPTSPRHNQLWLDSSNGEPYLLKKYNSNTLIWERVYYSSLSELDPTQNNKLNDNNQLLSDISNDNVITVSERRVVKDKLLQIVGDVIFQIESGDLPSINDIDNTGKGELYSIRKQSRDLGISVNHAEYKTVEVNYESLRSYLNSLTPVTPWNTTSSDSISIVADTWYQKWNDYYESVVKLKDLISDKVKELKEKAKKTEDDSKVFLSFKNDGFLITDKKYAIYGHRSITLASTFRLTDSNPNGWEAATSCFTHENGGRGFNIVPMNKSIRVFYGNQDKSDYVVKTFPSQNLIVGEWVTVIGVYDNGNSVFRLYVNGEEVGTISDRIDFIDNYLVVGKWSPNFSDYKSSIDVIDSRIYEKPLSASEVEAYVNGNPTVNELIGEWVFDQGAGFVVKDGSLEKNNLIKTSGGKWKGNSVGTTKYTEIQIDEVNQTTDDLRQQIDDASSDGKITRPEANALENSLSQVNKESIDLINIAKLLSITTEKTSYDNALSDLDSFLTNSWINQTSYPIDISSTERLSIKTKFENVQDTKSKLINKITEIQSQDGKTAYKETLNTLRNPKAIPDPTIATDGTSVDHTTNTDGSVDISFEWDYTEDSSSPINGFGVVAYADSSNASHTLNLSSDTVQYVDKESRAVIFRGVPSNKHYTFGVFAFRAVDTQIDANGIIRSNIVKPSSFGEDPYLPSSNVSFSGDILGTIGGTPYDEVNKSPATIIIASEEYSINYKKADLIVPQGSTSAQTTINEAITNIGNRGKVILLQGTYVCDGSVIVPDDIEIEGQGTSTIVEAYSDTVKLFVNSNKTSGNRNIIIRNFIMSIDSWWVSTQSSYGVYFENVSFSKVDNIYSFNIKYPIHVLKGSNLIITNNIVDNFVYAIYLQNVNNSTIGNNNVEVTNPDAREQENNGNIGLYLVGSHDNTINGGNIKDSSVGLRLDESNRNTFVGISLNTNYSIGAYLTNSNFNIFKGNQVYKNGTTGILINSSSSNNTVQGNSVFDNGLRKNRSYDNIQVANNSDSNNIQNNTVRKGEAVQVSGYIDTVKSSGNFIISGDFLGISDGYYNDAFFEVTSGTGAGQTGTIGNFIYIDSNTAEVYLNSGFATTPSVGDGYSIKVYPRYGLNISTTDCDANVVINNDLKNSGYDGNLSDSGTGTVTTSKNVIN